MCGILSACANLATWKAISAAECGVETGCRVCGEDVFGNLGVVLMQGRPLSGGPNHARESDVPPTGAPGTEAPSTAFPLCEQDHAGQCGS